MPLWLILFRILNICCAFPDQHCINKFLRCVAVFVDKTDFKVKICLHLLHSFAEHNRVNEAHHAWPSLLDEGSYIGLNSLEDAASLVRAPLQGLFVALTWLDALAPSCTAPKAPSTVLRQNDLNCARRVS